VVSDDDTFFFLHHLAKFLQDRDWRVPVLYAEKKDDQHFHGGAGWIASVTLMEKWMPLIDNCPKYGLNPTDRMLARCLTNELKMDFVHTKELAYRPPLDYFFRDGFGSDKNGDMGFPISFHHLSLDGVRTLWAIEQLILKPYRRCTSNFTFIGGIEQFAPIVKD
jgi:hypothetical protein